MALSTSCPTPPKTIPFADEGARPRRFYRPELDVLRLLAFLMVWLSHAVIPLAGRAPSRLLTLVEGAGSCGVPIFFFLSAFLITELMRREKDLTGTLHLPQFYLRRVLRIWPLYLGVLAVYGALGMRLHAFRIEPGRLLASCLLAGNWYLVFHPTITTPMRALWSISVEEQWYLCWPWLRLRSNDRQLATLCIALAAGSVLLLIALAHVSAQAELHVTAWVNSGVQFQYFAMGALTGLLLGGRIPQLTNRERCLLASAGALAILAAAGPCQIKQSGVFHSATSLVIGYLLAGLGTVCIFLSALGITARACPPALVRLGQLSFGLYVFHETGFSLAVAATRRLGAGTSIPSLLAEKLLALALTLVLAWASYRWWELPFLRLKQRWTFVRTREAA